VCKFGKKKKKKKKKKIFEKRKKKKKIKRPVGNDLCPPDLVSNRDNFFLGAVFGEQGKRGITAKFGPVSLVVEARFSDSGGFK